MINVAVRNDAFSNFPIPIEALIMTSSSVFMVFVDKFSCFLLSLIHDTNTPLNPLDQPFKLIVFISLIQPILILWDLLHWIQAFPSPLSKGVDF